MIQQWFLRLETQLLECCRIKVSFLQRRGYSFSFKFLYKQNTQGLKFSIDEGERFLQILQYGMYKLGSDGKFWLSFEGALRVWEAGYKSRPESGVDANAQSAEATLQGVPDAALHAHCGFWLHPRSLPAVLQHEKPSLVMIPCNSGEALNQQVTASVHNSRVTVSWEPSFWW